MRQAAASAPSVAAILPAAAAAGAAAAACSHQATTFSITVSMQAAGSSLLCSCCRQCCHALARHVQCQLPPRQANSCLAAGHHSAAAAAAASLASSSAPSTAGRRRVRAAAALYTSRLVEAAADVPVPLCQRPAQHAEQLASLMQWRDGVLQQITAIGEGFAAADGGPGAAELQREVTWVLDDAVAAWRERDAQQWQPCTWQQLQLELATAHRRQQQTDAWQVQLRAAVADLQELWRLRLKDRVPFQYLLHTAHWRDLVLSVGPGILVPRPETELLVDLAAAALAQSAPAGAAPAAAPWADLGTGSGALAIGLARLLLQHRTQQQQQQQPAVQVFAVDLSPTAAAYAAANAAAHGVGSAVTVLQGSWCEPLHAALAAAAAAAPGRPRQLLGGLLSNPPYIPRRQLAAGLQAEVAAHEPVTALDGGDGDGMDSLAVLCRQAVPLLAPGAFIGLETAGAEQAPLVQQLLQELADPDCGGAAFCSVRVHDDCYGVPRFVTATRR